MQSRAGFSRHPSKLGLELSVFTQEIASNEVISNQSSEHFGVFTVAVLNGGT